MVVESGSKMWRSAPHVRAGELGCHWLGSGWKKARRYRSLDMREAPNLATFDEALQSSMTDGAVLRGV